MELTDDRVFRRAQWAYEASRLKLGLGAALLVVLLPALSLGLGGELFNMVLLGGALAVAAGVLVWRGEALSRSALTGLKAGVMPLVLAHVANLYGHVCIPGRGCSTLCVPACAAGGLLAGIFVEWVARSSARPNVVRLAGAGVAFLTGALGCSCVGSAGLVGLIVGLTLTLGVGRLQARR